MKNLIFASRNFAKAPKYQKKSLQKSRVSIAGEFINPDESNALNPLKPSGKSMYHQNKNKPCILGSHCVYVIRVISTITSHYIPHQH
jgi:hypothetical protein